MTAHRRVPFFRQLRANAGKLMLGAVWLVCAIVAVVFLYATPGVATTAVASVHQYYIVPPESGRLVSVSVRAGQAVEAGQELAVIEIPGLSQQISAAAAAVDAIEADLALQAVELERKLSRDADASRARLLAARVDLAAAQAELAVVDTELSRYGADGVGTSPGVIEGLRLQRAGLADELRARETEIGELRDVWQSSRRSSGTATERLLLASLDAARGEHQALVALREACVLRAHVTGVVGSVFLESEAGSPIGHPGAISSGQWVQAGVPILTLSETAAAEAVTYVRPAVARTLSEGQPAQLVDDNGRSVAATVVSIGGAVEPMPMRHLQDPAFPEWGIPVTVRVVDTLLTPGELLPIRFTLGADGGQDGSQAAAKPVQ